MTVQEVRLEKLKEGFHISEVIDNNGMIAMNIKRSMPDGINFNKTITMSPLVYETSKEEQVTANRENHVINCILNCTEEIEKAQNIRKEADVNLCVHHVIVIDNRKVCTKCMIANLGAYLTFDKNDLKNQQ